MTGRSRLGCCMAADNLTLYRFACPSCQRVLKAPLSWSGKRGVCPGCQKPLEFPKRTSLFKGQDEAAKGLLKLVAEDIPGPGDDILDRLALLLAQGTCLDYSQAKVIVAPGPMPARSWRRVLPKAGQHEAMRLQMWDSVIGEELEDSLAFPSKDAPSEDALAWEIMVRFQDYLKHGTCPSCRANPTGLSCIYRTFAEFSEERELSDEAIRKWAKLCRQVFGLIQPEHAKVGAE